MNLACATGVRLALLATLLSVAATCPPSRAAENVVSLTPAQRANARIEVLRLEGSTTTPSAGLTVTGRVAHGGAARALVTAPVAARVATLAAYPGATVKRGEALLTLAGPEVAALQRTLREAEAEATLAARRLARDQRLLDEGVVAASRVEQSEATAAAAQARLRQVRASLPGFDARGADGEVVVRASADGVLAGPRLAAGAAVAAGDALAIIGAAGRLRVALAASPDAARALAAGDPLLVRSRGCEARAVLRAVGTAADASQAVPLDAEVLDADGCLLPGEAVTAVLSPRSAAQGGWALPPRAFVRRGAETFVFVERPQGFEVVAVDAAAARAGFARSTALRSGDAVAITGSALLKGAWLGLAGEE